MHAIRTNDTSVVGIIGVAVCSKLVGGELQRQA
jgi:hypothetical protein